MGKERRKYSLDISICPLLFAGYYLDLTKLTSVKRREYLIDVIIPKVKEEYTNTFLELILSFEAGSNEQFLVASTLIGFALVRMGVAFLANMAVCRDDACQNHSTVKQIFKSLEPYNRYLKVLPQSKQLKFLDKKCVNIKSLCYPGNEFCKIITNEKASMGLGSSLCAIQIAIGIMYNKNLQLGDDRDCWEFLKKKLNITDKQEKKMFIREEKIRKLREEKKKILEQKREETRKLREEKKKEKQKIREEKEKIREEKKKLSEEKKEQKRLREEAKKLLSEGKKRKNVNLEQKEKNSENKKKKISVNSVKE